MSNELQTLTPYSAIEKSVAKFTSECPLQFEREKSFALQQIKKTSYAFDVAKNNPMSVLNAMTNVAYIGLSLNPANAHAYLVPRDNAIHLDISYMGFLRLATDSGVIKMAKAEIVREKDKFVYRGMFENPVHEIENAFGKAELRGPVIGVYCVAILNDGGFITDFMDMDQIEKVKLSSKAFTSGKRCPWVDYEEEMMKKSMLKRARKTWPQSQGLDVFHEAIKVVNEHEGLSDELPSDDQYRVLDRYAQEYGKKDNEIARIADKKTYTDITANDAVKIISYIKSVESIKGSVDAIKKGIATGDNLAVHEATEELDNHEQGILLRAPTKGGPLTVEERNYLASDEYKSGLNQELDRIADEELDKQQLGAQ